MFYMFIDLHLTEKLWSADISTGYVDFMWTNFFVYDF